MAQIDEMRAALRDESDAGLKRLVELHRGADPASRQSTRDTWHALLADASLAPDALAAIERSGALSGKPEPHCRVLVQDLVSALGRWRYQAARQLLERLWSTSGPLTLRAGLALIAFGDRNALEAVAARLDETASGELRLALQAVFTIDPAHAWERLAPRFAAPSARAGIVLEATLHTLLRDIWDDGKQHWGATRGWFRADSRWLEECNAWRELPPKELRSTWGKAVAQKVVEVAAWLRKRAGEDHRVEVTHTR